MKRIIIALCLFTSIGTYAQKTQPIKEGITDGTYSLTTKTTYKVITDNQSIASALLTKYAHDLKSYTQHKKKDRDGVEYTEYTFTLPIEFGTKVIPYLRSWNKGK